MPQWRKPPSETENTRRWERTILQEGCGWFTGAPGPDSCEVVIYFVVLPFKLVFALLRLVVRVLSRGLKIWK